MNRHQQNGLNGRSNAISRRDFVQLAGLGAAGFAIGDRAAGFASQPGEKAVIQLLLVGGPSQLDTWDPKPAAPEEIRGPFSAIPTRTPGVYVSELFPRMARMSDKFAIVRTVHHDEAPIHETGCQLMQTGRLFADGIASPHMGAVAGRLLGARRGMPAWVGVDRPIGNTGVAISHGQEAANLGGAFEARWLADAADPRLLLAGDCRRESSAVRERYGSTKFGDSCLTARRLVEAGVRFVTVNMFDTVFGQVTWDMHANGGSLATGMDDYRYTLGPTFDRAFTALLGDLDERGMLDDVMVVAMGEFGRTPKINPRGGRDHWPGCWSILFAGGGVQGGRVVGQSDHWAAEPYDRPVTPAEVVGTVYRALGVNPRTISAPAGVVDCASAPAIGELFA